MIDKSCCFLNNLCGENVPEAITVILINTFFAIYQINHPSFLETENLVTNDNRHASETNHAYYPITALGDLVFSKFYDLDKLCYYDSSKMIALWMYY